MFLLTLLLRRMTMLRPLHSIPTLAALMPPASLTSRRLAISQLLAILQTIQKPYESLDCLRSIIYD
jgi:hypothetical protein